MKNIYDSDNAKDLVQEIFIALWNNIRKAKSWLFTVAHNKMLTYIRDSQRHQVEVFSSLSTSNNYENEQLVNYLCQELTPPQRQALMLKDWEGFSTTEIAKIMQIKESSVKQNIFRAKIKVKKILEQSKIK